MGLSLSINGLMKVLNRPDLSPWRKRILVSVPTINLSNNDGGSESPDIAAIKNMVYVVWRDTSPGNSDIFYRRSTDGGATFGPTINLSNNQGSSGSPALAVDHNNVYLV